MGAVGLQAFIIHQNDPWHAWQLAPWSDAPFSEVALDREALTVPSTYVTVTNISYSLIAPRFPASSRWVNISSLPDARELSPDVSRMQAILASSKSLKLLIPSRPEFTTVQGLPTEGLLETINGMLGTQRLSVARSSDCRLLPSKGLASEAVKDVDAAAPAMVAKFGFWVCALKYPVASRPQRLRLTQRCVGRSKQLKITALAFSSRGKPRQQGLLVPGCGLIPRQISGSMSWTMARCSTSTGVH